MSDEDDALSTTAFAAGVATATAAQAAETAEESEGRSEAALDVAQSAHERVDHAQATAEEARAEALYTREEMDARFADQENRFGEMLSQLQATLAAGTPPQSADDDRAPAPPAKEETEQPDKAAVDEHQADGDKPTKKTKKKRSDGFSARWFGSDS